MEQGEELTVSVSAVADADGTPQGGFVFTRQWQRGVTVTDAQSGQDTTTWTDITDADGATYTLVQADVGQQVRVVVSFTDAAGNDESLTSTATGPVADINDAPTGTVTITGTVEQGEELTVSVSAVADADGTPQGGFVFTRQWQRGVTVTDAQSGQDTTTWTDITDADGATYTLVQADVGQQVRVVVSFTDAAGNDESLTSTATGPVADINDAPTGTVTLTGTVEQGEELTVSVSAVADADGTPQGGFVFTRQWQRGVTVTDAQSGQDTTTWTDITDADGATYTLVQADVGQQVRVVVSFTDAAGNDESLTSTATGPVADINDAPTGTVTLTGTVEQGEELTVSVSAVADADGTPQGGFVFTRQWQRGVTVTDAQSGQDTTTWTDITDADGATYTLVQADVGQQVRVVVSFTDAAGNDESLPSTATGPVADINDAPTGTVTLTGTVEQGEELTVSVSAVADADGTPQGGFVFTRQWQRGVTVTDAQSGQDTTTWTDITDADGATYTLVQADVGQQVRVVVSFTDAAGNDESLTSTATGPVADINDAPTGTVTLTGTVEQGEELTVSVSAVADADGTPQGGFVFTRQWQRGVTVTDAQSGQDTTTWTDITDADGGNLHAGAGGRGAAGTGGGEFYRCGGQ